MEKKAPKLTAGKAVTGALVTALIIKLFFFDFMVAEGHSMEPAIREGKVFFVWKLNYGFKPPGARRYLVRWASPKSGEIVVFVTPFGEIAVKRCGEIYPENYFYALGDNSAHSWDSRSYGPVPVDNIVGKVPGIR